MTVDRFQRQLSVPRPLEFETPMSYLTRICAANVIDVEYIKRSVQQRRTATRRTDALGHIIEELGGPSPAHFEKEFQRSRTSGAPRAAAHAFSEHAPRRPACSKCSRGELAFVYFHREYMVCRRHARWLGGTFDNGQVDVGHSIVRLDRRLRTVMRAGFITAQAYELVADQLRAQLTGTSGPNGRAPGNRTVTALDSFESQVRLLEVITDYHRVFHPKDRPVGDWYRRPEEEQLRSFLRPRTRWVESLRDPAYFEIVETFLERLVEISLRSLYDRSEPWQRHD